MAVVIDGDGTPTTQALRQGCVVCPEPGLARKLFVGLAPHFSPHVVQHGLGLRKLDIVYVKDLSVCVNTSDEREGVAGAARGCADLHLKAASTRTTAAVKEKHHGSHTVG
jgi:hypothetical protein